MIRLRKTVCDVEDGMTVCAPEGVTIVIHRIRQIG